MFRSSSVRRFVAFAHTPGAVEKREKPAEFANGSLLGNDSRIFVQHPAAYPLSRTRCATPVSPTHPPLPLISAPRLSWHPSSHLPPISLFQSSTVPRHTGVLHPLTFHFALSRFCFFGALPLSVSLSFSRSCTPRSSLFVLWRISPYTVSRRVSFSFLR